MSSIKWCNFLLKKWWEFFYFYSRTQSRIQIIHKTFPFFSLAERVKNKRVWEFGDNFFLKNISTPLSRLALSINQIFIFLQTENCLLLEIFFPDLSPATVKAWAKKKKNNKIKLKKNRRKAERTKRDIKKRKQDDFNVLAVCTTGGGGRRSERENCKIYEAGLHFK